MCTLLDDVRNNRTRRALEKMEACEEYPKEEEKFWKTLVKSYLKPESANLSNVNELKKKLTDLRNYSVLVLLLTNVMWIIFLYTLAFPQLAKFNLPDRAFSLLFVAVFSFITIIQFVAMVFHRFATLLHVLAASRVKIRRKNAV